MILGWEDIAGGATIAAVLVWLGLTLLFYVVCYLAVLNIIDDFTRNRLIKIPLLVFAAFPASFLMAIFHYHPIILFVLTGISNFFRVKHRAGGDRTAPESTPLNKPLFYTASYLYLVLLLILPLLLQSPTQAGGKTVPYWESLLPAP